MLSDTRAASSDDYFRGEASSGDPEDEERDITVREDPPSPEPTPTLAAEVVDALKAAGIRGKLRDPRRDAPGGKTDFATAPVVQVKLEDGSLTGMLRTQLALHGFAWREGRPDRTVYVSRRTRSLAEDVRLALCAQDLIDGWDFHLGDPRVPRGATPDLATAETVCVRLVSHTSTPWSMRNMLDIALNTLRAYFPRHSDQPMELLVSRNPA